MLHEHVQLFLQTLALVFLLVRIPSIRPPKSMFKFITAEMATKSASEASVRKD